MQPSPPWFYALAGALALERGLELALTRRNLRGRGARAAAGGRAHYAGMVAVHAALLALPASEVALRGLRAPAALFFAAAAVLLLAQALRWWCIAVLGRAWNARAVVDPSLGFVEKGPYRWVRHPNYLAVVLEFLALPAAGGAWISLALLNLAHAPILARRIASEDALLREVPGYAQAMGAKGRLLPRPRRAS